MSKHPSKQWYWRENQVLTLEKAVEHAVAAGAFTSWGLGNGVNGATNEDEVEQVKAVLNLKSKPVAIQLTNALSPKLTKLIGKTIYFDVVDSSFFAKRFGGKGTDIMAGYEFNRVADRKERFSKAKKNTGKTPGQGGQFDKDMLVIHINEKSLWSVGAVVTALADINVQLDAVFEKLVIDRDVTRKEVKDAIDDSKKEAIQESDRVYSDYRAKRSEGRYSYEIGTTHEKAVQLKLQKSYTLGQTLFSKVQYEVWQMTYDENGKPKPSSQWKQVIAPQSGDHGSASITDCP